MSAVIGENCIIWAKRLGCCHSTPFLANAGMYCTKQFAISVESKQLLLKLTYQQTCLNQLVVFKHPLNAVIAALEIQKQIQEYNEYKMEAERFNVRVGLNTGRVIRKDSDIYGDTVNVASRMETSASPGDIYLTQNTYDEIKEYIRCTRLGDLQIKGKTEAITAYQAQEILIDMNKVMAESAEREGAAKGGIDAGSLRNLKESMFKPQFEVPAGVDLNDRLLSGLEGLFADMSEAVEKISQDYHEEFIFKRFLHDKWNEIMGAAGKIEDSATV